ncbi:GNAT family N-acetyltransferase [Paenibacillus sp. OSY-SE]|uniref:GNAT family N-acetyltransferase n=1 Tax=Paenibacillus sp. OSY-SE TaxID=1196323 RepID=UPI00037D4717|nr:GNAT family N-acetyltransferase [Paenibacillus sp. OSY-SE]
MNSQKDMLKAIDSKYSITPHSHRADGSLNEYRHPFLIKIGEEIAGFIFVLTGVPKEYVKLSTANKTNVISDFFIMRKFRRRNYGKQAAFRLFDRFPGAWEIRQTETNIQAHQFWKRVIDEYTKGKYLEEHVQDDRWREPVQCFQNDSHT